MKQIRLKTGEELTVRRAREEDAKRIIDYINLVGGETDYLSFGENEFEVTEEREREIIKGFQQSENSFMLLAESNNTIAGLLTLECGSRLRLMHRGEFGLTVSRVFWGKGIGRVLVEEMLSLAGDSGVTRIGLQVRADNERAIKLYSDLGFRVEGRLKRFMRIRGEYFDFLQMGIDL